MKSALQLAIKLDQTPINRIYLRNSNDQWLEAIEKQLNCACFELSDGLIFVSANKGDIGRYGYQYSFDPQNDSLCDGWFIAEHVYQDAETWEYLDMPYLEIDRDAMVRFELAIAEYDQGWEFYSHRGCDTRHLSINCKNSYVWDEFTINDAREDVQQCYSSLSIGFEGRSGGHLIIEDYAQPDGIEEMLDFLYDISDTDTLQALRGVRESVEEYRSLADSEESEDEEE